MAGGPLRGGGHRRWRRRHTTVRERAGLFILLGAGQGSPGAAIHAELVLPRLKGERLGLYVLRLGDSGLWNTRYQDGKVMVALPNEREAN